MDAEPALGICAVPVVRYTGTPGVGSDRSQSRRGAERASGYHVGYHVRPAAGGSASVQ